MWNATAISKRLDIEYPFIQGPFGGGGSSVDLVAAVSNAGGLGSFGLQTVEANEIGTIHRTYPESDRTSFLSQPLGFNTWKHPGS
jgi:nitronate monooxygenase